MVKQRGLFDRQPRYYTGQALFVSLLLIAGFAAIVALPGFPLKLSGAVLLAFAMTHLGYIVHDAGHRQIFSSIRANNATLLICGFFSGVSPSWWVKTHNRHHSFTNEIEKDPHLAIPALAFSDGQANAKHGLMRFVSRFQAFYFFPLLTFEGLGIRLASIQFLGRGEARHPYIEATGMVLHLALYGFVLLATMSVLQTLAFITLHHVLLGLYMGSVFAPNHKGMPLIERDTQLDFLQRQLVTTRNIRPHPISDFWFGGLNYQIEHHLFPTVPRNKLKSTRLIVRSFCEEHELPHLETSFVESYAQVLRYLHQTVQPRRHPAIETVTLDDALPEHSHEEADLAPIGAAANSVSSSEG